MQEHTHSWSGTQIEGFRLVAGAEIRGTDRYDSSTGKWEPPPPAVGRNMDDPYDRGLTLEEGCPTMWIRPELSDNTKELLMLLRARLLDIHEKSMTATRLPIGRWEQYPVPSRESVQELRDCGLVAPYQGKTYETEFTTVLRLTELGRETAEGLLS